MGGRASSSAGGGGGGGTGGDAGGGAGGGAAVVPNAHAAPAPAVMRAVQELVSAFLVGERTSKGL